MGSLYSLSLFNSIFLYNIYQCGVQHKVVVIVVVVTNNAINEMDSKDEKNVSDGGKCQLLYQ